MKKQLESALRYLADGNTIVYACACYGEKTNSTAAIVALLKVRELITTALQPAVEADAQKECRCYKFYKQQNSYSFCPDCGRDLRTA